MAAVLTTLVLEMTLEHPLVVATALEGVAPAASGAAAAVVKKTGINGYQTTRHLQHLHNMYIHIRHLSDDNWNRND